MHDNTKPQPRNPTGNPTYSTSSCEPGLADSLSPNPPAACAGYSVEILGCSLSEVRKFAFSPSTFFFCVSPASLLSFSVRVLLRPSLSSIHSSSHRPPAIATRPAWHSFSSAARPAPSSCIAREERLWLAKWPIIFPGQGCLACLPLTSLVGASCFAQLTAKFWPCSDRHFQRLTFSQEAFLSPLETKPHHVTVAFVGWCYGNWERA